MHIYRDILFLPLWNIVFSPPGYISLKRVANTCVNWVKDLEDLLTGGRRVIHHQLRKYIISRTWKAPGDVCYMTEDHSGDLWVRECVRPIPHSVQFLDPMTKKKVYLPELFGVEVAEVSWLVLFSDPRCECTSRRQGHAIRPSEWSIGYCVLRGHVSW